MTDNRLSTIKVNNRKDFIKFLDLLRQDFIDNPDSWENKNLIDFLEVIRAFSADIQGYYDNTNQNIDADEPNWKTFADILNGAKIYE